MNVPDFLQRLSIPRALIVGFFIASLYYFFVYDNGATQVSAIQQGRIEITTQQKLLKDLTAKLEKAHEYQKSAAEMGETLNKLLSYIPENFRLQDFMKVVSEEAKLAGLNIIRIQDNKSSSQAADGKRPEFEELVVSIELQGSFAQHMTFMSNLTKQKQIFTIETYKMDKSEAESENPVITFRADIRAYRYIGPKAKS